jgi:uncharacterized OB-fold protein
VRHRGSKTEVPYAIAVVELSEGPRMLTNIVGVDNTPESLVLDMDLEVDFEPNAATRRCPCSGRRERAR